MPQALAGLRVLDLAELEGHYVGRLLADMGADVIKVEPPGGDPARNLSPFAGGIRDPERSLVFANFNANKRGIVVDIDSEDGQHALKQLAATTDILVETSAPGSMDQRGVGYTALREINPRLIYVSLTPFGLDGPHSGYKALEKNTSGNQSPRLSSQFLRILTMHNGRPPKMLEKLPILK